VSSSTARKCHVVKVHRSWMCFSIICLCVILCQFSLVHSTIHRLFQFAVYHANYASSACWPFVYVHFTNYLPLISVFYILLSLRVWLKYTFVVLLFAGISLVWRIWRTGDSFRRAIRHFAHSDCKRDRWRLAGRSFSSCSFSYFNSPATLQTVQYIVSWYLGVISSSSKKQTNASM